MGVYTGDAIPISYAKKNQTALHSYEPRTEMIKKGQIYFPTKDIDIICMTSWRAPFTGGYYRILPKGERFRITNDPVDGATAVYCDPLEYRKLHKQMVPRSDRIRFILYAGYYFCISLKTISECCEQIKQEGEQVGSSNGG